MERKYEDQFKAVVLGALFHDIGKFYQRSDPEVNYRKSSLLEYETKKNIDLICPSGAKGYSHKHALWTFDFFLKNKDYFRHVFNNEKLLGEDNLTNLASYHHNPSTVLQLLIQQADWYSSGMDRTNADEELIEIEGGKYNYRFTRLRPIFEEIELDKHKAKQNYKYEIKPLKMAKTELFPKKITELHPEPGKDLWKEYKDLWDRFENEIKGIKASNFYYLIDSYLSLLEKYTWSIPSSTNDMPDISLFDHLKTTAAIASCLYRYHENVQFSKETIKDKSEDKFILLGGDLSGIQNYIFDLTHVNLKKVSKTLRGRSFYLSALTKVLVTKILFENGLTSANCLMESGGRFILLLPKSNQTIEYLEQLERELGEWCMNEFYGELMVGLDWSISLNGYDFFKNGGEENSFSKKIDELNHKLEVKKLQKYSFKINNKWENTSFVIGLDYEKLKEDTTELCRTCGKKPASESILDEEGELIQICNTCFTHQEIGKALTRRSVFSIQILNNQKVKKLKKPAFNFNFGSIVDDESIYSLILHRENDLGFLNEPNFITAFALDKSETSELLPRYYLANYVPRFTKEDVEKYKKLYDSTEIEHIKEGEIKTFNELAIPPNQINDPNDKSGTPYLAIIKADVDNLGLIFSQGIQKHFSISRYSTLSRMLNIFFCGYLNTFLEERFPNIYTVYAGGDDLFLIGNWLDIVELAPELNDEFKSYTCHNDDLHLSAAIELIKRRSPIRKGAEQAEEALEEAKSKKDERGIPVKNSFNLFNSVLNWTEWKWIKNWMEFFDEKIKENKTGKGSTNINTAFLYRLLKYQQMALDYIKNKDVKGLLYLSYLNYDIARNIQNNKNPDMDNELKILHKLTHINENKKIIENIHIPIFYALYKNRGGR